ncbi:hypothetical protein PN419_14735 [Halorubrum ezzemoulense]|jgi:hypothetical protein|uniref:hypothetical protein n=1 Tax=Halorubrum ezzemoulense TaxID=337243 RepID=UPI0023306DE4|nr:hypothetical protein [Halorubrum ezzemoulense]MDB9234623.1 hypothetical protein [Halorubrum ezzemoulense]MDB9250241.1 hypothetical protein [Halorubrum ezzemoulense]MDB9260381.1 hypothetical protein [Halorubrum ezzemoulense]MDB9263676.1 hypothetical protein [Halorubrum ezzemoulense]MDB9267307.1 hypothetical protein [Halorubrum ezzemoulense]
MKDPESKTVFAGVDGRTDTELPDWYRRKKTVDEPRTFAEAIRDLPQAVETTVAYWNPYSDEWVETERFNALVEPTRARDHATDDEPDTDPLFHVPTDSYAIINPIDVYGPLEEVLREETIDETPLGEVMFGEIRRYRGGGEVHMDIMFDGLEVRLPGRSDPITMGVTSGYDFFGEHAVYVEGFAQDGYCSNTMRSLTDKEVIKHVGDVRNFRTWWEEILAQVELVADDLFEFIRDAQDIDLDFSELPFTVTEFYSLLGFPDYLAERAAEDAEANAASPFEIDMWTLHSGATYALTHFFQGKEGASLDGYVRTANDILFNPEGTIERVERAYEEQLEADGDDGSQASLAGERALACIERVNDDLQEKVDQFEEREDALRERFQDAMS